MCCVYVHCNNPNSGKHPTVTAASRLRCNHLPTTSEGVPFCGVCLIPQNFDGLLSSIIMFHIMFHIKWPFLGFTWFTWFIWVYHIFRQSHMVPSLSPVCLGCNVPQNDPVRRKVIYLPVKLIVTYRPLGRTRRPWFGQWRDKVRAESTPIYEFLWDDIKIMCLMFGVPMVFLRKKP